MQVYLHAALGTLPNPNYIFKCLHPIDTQQDGRRSHVPRIGSGNDPIPGVLKYTKEALLGQCESVTALLGQIQRRAETILHPDNQRNLEALDKARDLYADCWKDGLLKVGTDDVPNHMRCRPSH